MPHLRAGKQYSGRKQKYSSNVNVEVLSVGFGPETGNLSGGS